MFTPYNKLNLQQKQHIVEAFNYGMECRNIPNYIGVSGRAVARVLNEAGINTKRRRRTRLKASLLLENLQPSKYRSIL